ERAVALTGAGSQTRLPIAAAIAESDPTLHRPGPAGRTPAGGTILRRSDRQRPRDAPRAANVVQKNLPQADAGPVATDRSSQRPAKRPVLPQLRYSTCP